MHIRVPGVHNDRAMKLLKNGDIEFLRAPFTRNVVHVAGGFAFVGAVASLFAGPVLLPLLTLGAGVSLGMQWLAKGASRIVFRKKRRVVDLYDRKGQKPRTIRFEDVEDIALVRWSRSHRTADDMRSDFEGWWTAVKLTSGQSIRLTEHGSRWEAESVRAKLLAAMGREWSEPRVS